MRKSCLSLFLVVTLVYIQTNFAAPIATEQDIFAEFVHAETNSSESDGCEANLECGDCVKDKSCVWCKSDDTCKQGSIYGPKGEIFKGCDDFRWAQCKVPGKIVFWGGVGVVVLFLLFLVVAFFCCCCMMSRRRRRNIKAKQISWEEEREELLTGNQSATPKTDERRSAMYAKYGTPEERERKKQERKARGNDMSVFDL
eukprot:TRINITY_DN2816_c0_g1_i1.p1 TRINITY_DN2816_c0_g1~~TRINITY_DN2816_c0_g1_i1.p1  ORF type:complete len:199 (+),score=33.05 TRINITY_DN2816_c0_g1_i1:106-702(+)